MKTIAQQLKIKEFPFRIYDNNGNEVYYENPHGYWIKREYDSNQNKTYYESSDGVWCKSEYDSKGNEIYFEDSDGFVEDKRPKSCEGRILEIDGIKYELKAKK